MQGKLIADFYNFVVLTPTIRAAGNIDLKCCFFKIKFGQVEAEVMFESDTSWKEALIVCVWGGNFLICFFLKNFIGEQTRVLLCSPLTFSIGGLEISMTFMLSYLCAFC